MDEFSQRIQDVYKIYNSLLDELSKSIFKARLMFALTHDEGMFLSDLRQLNQSYEIPEFFEFMDYHKHDRNKVIIYGSNPDLTHTIWLLTNNGVNPIGIVCDAIEDKYDLESITHNQLVTNYRDCIVVIASEADAFNIYKSLLYAKFPTQQILCPRRGILEGYCGVQYFDYFTHCIGMEEVFVDCGAYDGGTSIEFINWCNSEYDKIYMFEADNDNFRNCQANVIRNNLRNMHLYHSALWNEDGMICFDSGHFTSSCVSERGDTCVEATRLDSLLRDQYVTFIKMDIEGAECEALEGAHKILEKQKPKLAISAYHKPDDIVRIPLLVWRLNSDYRFALRQYRSNRRETVLYAI